MVNERLDTELSATARQIIADARGADDPSAEDEARVKARWLAGIAAGAGVSSLSEAVRAAAGGGGGLKAVAMIAAAAAASVGVYLGWPESKHDAHTPPAVSVQSPSAAPVAAQPVVAPVEPEPVAATEPEPASAAAQAAPSAAEAAEPEAAAPAATEAAPAPVPSTPPRAVRARAVAAERTRAPAHVAGPAAAAAAPVGGQLGEEIALLSQIRGTLQDGAAARALEQLGEYRRRFEHPNLAMEADALRVDALCSAGQREAAQAAATAFINQWPGSPLQQRVSAACP